MSKKIVFELNEADARLLLVAVRHAKLKAQSSAADITELGNKYLAMQMIDYSLKIEDMEKKIEYQIHKQIP